MLQEAELSGLADSENNLGGSSETMDYIGLDVHKKRISYCVKDAAGVVHREGKIGATRCELDDWVRTLRHPLNLAVVLLDLQRHLSNLLQHRNKRQLESWRHGSQTALGKTLRRRGRQL